MSNVEDVVDTVIEIAEALGQFFVRIGGDACAFDSHEEALVAGTAAANAEGNQAEADLYQEYLIGGGLAEKAAKGKANTVLAYNGWVQAGKPVAVVKEEAPAEDAETEVDGEADAY